VSLSLAAAEDILADAGFQYDKVSRLRDMIKWTVYIYIYIYNCELSSGYSVGYIRITMTQDQTVKLVVCYR
jgi:hypothetical protein